MNRPRLVVVIVGIVIIVIMGYHRAGAQDPSGDKRDRLPEAAESAVGMILPFYHPDLRKAAIDHPDTFTPDEVYRYIPRNWVLCDGQALDQNHTQNFRKREIHARFWKSVTPDFTARFPRGASVTGDPAKPEPAGTVSGKDQHAGKLDHAHTMPTQTGKISNSGENPGSDSYLIRDDAGWRRDRHIDVKSGNSTIEGHHYHNFGGNTGELKGYLMIPTVPAYVAVYYIMRIK